MSALIKRRVQAPFEKPVGLVFGTLLLAIGLRLRADTLPSNMAIAVGGGILALTLVQAGRLAKDDTG